jgi:hypothetical protein
MISIKVDYEHNGEAWWDNGGRNLWQNLLIFEGISAPGWDVSEVVVSDAVAKEWIDKASRVDGWEENPFLVEFVSLPARNH